MSAASRVCRGSSSGRSSTSNTRSAPASAAEHRAHLHRDLVDRAGELARVVDEDGQTADVKAVARMQRTPPMPDGQRIADTCPVLPMTGPMMPPIELRARSAFRAGRRSAARTRPRRSASSVEDLDDLLSSTSSSIYAVDRAERRLLRHVVLAAERPERCAPAEQVDTG